MQDDQADKVTLWRSRVKEREKQLADAVENIEWFKKNDPGMLQTHLIGIPGLERNLEYAKKQLARALRRDPRRGLRLVKNESIELLRSLIREVVIAGEVETGDLYADYRPTDPKAYIGMILGVDGEEGGSNGSSDDNEPFAVDAPRSDSPEVSPTETEPTETDEVEIETPQTS